MKIRNILGAAVIALAGSMISSPAFAAVTCPPNSVNSTADTLAGCNVTPDNSLMPTINTIISVIIGVLGLVAVVVIILGGVSYTTSAGDPGKVKKAKDTILYGIIGLVVAILAFAIVNFVLSSFFNNSAVNTSSTASSAPSPSGH